MREENKIKIEETVINMKYGSTLRLNKKQIDKVLADMDVLTVNDFKNKYPHLSYNLEELLYFKKLINKQLKVIKGTLYAKI